MRLQEINKTLFEDRGDFYEQEFKLDTALRLWGQTSGTNPETRRQREEMMLNHKKDFMRLGFSGEPLGWLYRGHAMSDEAMEIYEQTNEVPYDYDRISNKLSSWSYEEKTARSFIRESGNPGFILRAFDLNILVDYMRVSEYLKSIGDHPTAEDYDLADPIMEKECVVINDPTWIIGRDLIVVEDFYD